MLETKAISAAELLTFPLRTGGAVMVLVFTSLFAYRKALYVLTCITESCVRLEKWNIILKKIHAVWHMQTEKQCLNNCAIYPEIPEHVLFIKDVSFYAFFSESSSCKLKRTCLCSCQRRNIQTTCERSDLAWATEHPPPQGSHRVTLWESPLHFHPSSQLSNMNTDESWALTRNRW